MPAVLRMRGMVAVTSAKIVPRTKPAKRSKVIETSRMVRCRGASRVRFRVRVRVRDGPLQGRVSHKI